MCQICEDLLAEYYPHLSTDDRYEVAFNATAFPFGGAEHLEKQLKELKEKTDGTVQGAINFAHEQLFADWERCKQEEKAK